MNGLRPFVFTLILGLSACAGVSYQEFRPANEPLKTIALLTVANPPAYAANDFANPGLMFGAVGGAVAGGRAANATEALTAAVKQSGFEFQPAMQSALQRALHQAGYHVVPLHIQRPNPHKPVDDYRALPTAGADAYLDISTQMVGYATLNFGDRDFRPYVKVTARLVSVKTKTVLYSESIVFGYHNRFDASTKLPADKRYYFKKFDDLMANSVTAVDGIKVGADAIAVHVASRLRKK